MLDLSARRPALIYGGWALLGLVVIAANVAYLRSVRAYEWSASFERAETTAELMEQALLRSADGVSSVLNFAQTRVELGREGAIEAAAALDRRLQDIIDEQRFGIRGIASVRLDGIVDWSPSGAFVGRPVTERERFAVLGQATRQTLAISPPFISQFSGQWIITAARSMHDDQGRITGIVVVGFDPMQLNRLLHTVAGRPERSLVIRQIADGRVRGASHDAHRRMAAPPEPRHHVVLAARQAEAGRLQYISALTGRPVMTAFRTVRGRDMVVYAAFDEAAAMAPYRRIARPVIAAVLLYLLSSLVMAAACDRNARLRRNLHALATLDPLTGLHNRRSLEERMRGHGREEFACLLFDIDHFKSINDRFGHGWGDQVLRDVASLLRAEVRAGDIVCRWGGEEMLVVLRSCDQAAAQLRAEALSLGIQQLYDEAARVTVSVGVACFPGDGDTLEAITALADAALYRAKRGGRNRVMLAEA